MPSNVRMNIDHTKAVRAMHRLGTAAVSRAARTTVTRAKWNLLAAGRVDTMALYDSITSSKTDTPMGFEVSAGRGLPDKRAIYQEKGTRAHGPVKAKVMVFRAKGGGPMVFAHRVRGIEAARYMQAAREALSVKDFTE